MYNSQIQISVNIIIYVPILTKICNGYLKLRDVSWLAYFAISHHYFDRLVACVVGAGIDTSK